MILTYEAASKKIIFEFERLLPNGIIQAKTGLDSLLLETGEHSEPFFNREEVREASGEEVEYFDHLRKISPFKS